MGYKYEDEDDIVQTSGYDTISDNLISQTNVNTNVQSESSTPSTPIVFANTVENTNQVNTQNSTQVIYTEFQPVQTNSKTIEDLMRTDDTSNLEVNNLITQDDEKYYMIFIGKNYQKITKNTFNFSAFFFGGFYLVYRKMYLIGIIWILLNMFISTFFPIANIEWYVIVIALIISYVVCGFAANGIYLNHVGTQVLNLKLAKVKDLKESCRKKGGTSFLIAFLVYLLLNGIVLFASFSSIIGLFS